MSAKYRIGWSIFIFIVFFLDIYNVYRHPLLINIFASVCISFCLGAGFQAAIDKKIIKLAYDNAEYLVEKFVDDFCKNKNKDKENG